MHPVPPSELSPDAPLVYSFNELLMVPATLYKARLARARGSLQKGLHAFVHARSLACSAGAPSAPWLARR